MADFIDFQAVQDDQQDVIMVSDDDEIEEKEVFDDFIDDSAALDEVDVSFYRATDIQREQQSSELQNVGNIDEILEEELEQSFVDAQDLDIQNLCHSDEEIEPEVNFSSADKRLKAFKETFFRLDKNLTLKEAILYAIRYEQTKKTCQIINADAEFNFEFSTKILDNWRIELNLRNFNNMCFELTEMLMQHNYFLRIFELRNRFQEVSLKTTTKKKLRRELSSCIKIKFDGFEIVSLQCSRELQKKFTPIDVIINQS